MFNLPDPPAFLPDDTATPSDKPQRSPGEQVLFTQRRLQKVFGRKPQQVRRQSLNSSGKKRGPIAKFLRTALYGLLLVSTFTGTFSAMGYGNHLKLEHERQSIMTQPYDGWADTAYSRELAEWQQDNNRASPRYSVAIVDIDQFRDPSMSEDDKRAEFRRQMAAMLPSSVYNSFRNNGRLEKAFQDVLSDRGIAYGHNELSVTLNPIHSSSHRHDLNAEGFTGFLNTYLTERFTIVVASDGLKTADHRLRDFSAMSDARYGFECAANPAQVRHWTIAHEVGHAHDSNGAEHAHDDIAGEMMADAFAAIDHVARFGPESNLPECFADARALGAIRGSIDHYTSPALYEAAATARALHASGALQQMSRAEMVDLAGKIAQKHEFTADQAQKLVEFSRVLRGHDSDNAEYDGFYVLHNLDPEALQADLDEYADHPHFAGTPQVKQLAEFMRQAFASRLLPAAQLSHDARPEAQLRALLEDRNIGPNFRNRIFAHARAELESLRNSTQNDADARSAWQERERAINLLERAYPDTSKGTSNLASPNRTGL